MPKRKRRARRNRRRKRTLRNPLGKLAKVRLEKLVGSWWSTLAIAMLPVLALNLTVRWVGGGDAHLLSFRHLGHKAQAVGMLLRHGAQHLWASHPDDLHAVVRAAAREAGIPGRFALGVARAESDFRPHAISGTGAMGLMQMMPETAEAFGAVDPFDPVDNARAATRYLGWLWKRYRGDRRRILAAYNAGPGRVPRNGDYRLPRETRRYVARILD